MPKKVVLTGPESTGKSFLTHQLAVHFQCPQVPEMARAYLGNLDRPYTFEDVEAIARQQLMAEEKAMSENAPLIFCDTNLLVIKIWMLHSWGHCPQWILQSLKFNPGDLTLLCDIDMPWQPDPLREHPHLRQYFADWYRRELEQSGTIWQWVKGTGEDRTALAISHVRHHFQSVLEE